MQCTSELVTVMSDSSHDSRQLRAWYHPAPESNARLAAGRTRTLICLFSISRTVSRLGLWGSMAVLRERKGVHSSTNLWRRSAQQYYVVKLKE